MPTPCLADPRFSVAAVARSFRRAAGLCAVALLLAAPMACAAAPVESVPRLDLGRYAGLWYELARLPNRFQASCATDVTATYTPLEGGAMDVLNRCRERSGEVREARGRAFPAPGRDSGARWELSFLPSWLQWVPFGRGDYWIVLLDPDYLYAVVSEPTREFLWILSRSPSVDPVAYQRILEQLQRAGYPVEKLQRTPHHTGPAVARLSRML